MRTTKAVALGVAAVLALTACSGQATEDESATDAGTVETTEPASEETPPADAFPEAPQDVNVAALAGEPVNSWNLIAACRMLVGEPSNVGSVLGGVSDARLSAKWLDKNWATGLNCEYGWGDRGEAGYDVSVFLEATTEYSSDCGGDVTAPFEGGACVALRQQTRGEHATATTERLAFVDQVAAHAKTTGENSFPDAPPLPEDMPQPDGPVSFSALMASENSRDVIDACFALVGTPEEITVLTGADRPLELSADTGTHEYGYDYVRCSYHSTESSSDGYSLWIKSPTEDDKCVADSLIPEAPTSDGALCLSFNSASSDGPWPPKAAPFDLQRWVELMAENVTA